VVVGTQERVKQRWETTEQPNQYAYFTKKAPVPMIYSGDKKIGPGFWPQISNNNDIETELIRISEMEKKIKKEMGKIPSCVPEPAHGTLTVFSNRSVK
jgi:hypothetical protein